MPPIVYLVRHAEGEHNVNDSHHIRDALLTDKGKEQCFQLRDRFPYHDDISLVLASPLRRTIQTAPYAFASVLKNSNVAFVLVPQAQEISALACDVGQERSVLEEELPNLITNELLDFDSVKKGIYVPRLQAVKERAAALRSWLWQRPESHIVLLTHGAFLHYLTEDWHIIRPEERYISDKSLLYYHLLTTMTGTAYQNCEFRRFAFSEASHGQEAHLFEVGGTGVKQGRPLGIETTVLKEIVAVESQPCQRISLISRERASDTHHG
ncbi:histidine phosphatase superfamily [Lipomyces tetrasporus]